MKTITLLLLGFALAVGAVAQDETKKSDEKKSEKKAAASNDKLQADLVTKEKALWDAWGKKDGKPFEESMNPDTVGVDAVILTYKADQDVTCGGQKMPSTVYASSIWKKQGGKWWAAFHQETPAAPAQQ